MTPVLEQTDCLQSCWSIADAALNFLAATASVADCNADEQLKACTGASDACHDNCLPWAMQSSSVDQQESIIVIINVTFHERPIKQNIC